MLKNIYLPEHDTDTMTQKANLIDTFTALAMFSPKPHTPRHAATTGQIVASFIPGYIPRHAS